MPDRIFTDETLEETLTLEQERMSRSEAWAELIVGAGFALSVAAIFALDPSPRALDPGIAILCVLLLAFASRARFFIVRAWTAPVQVIFVPVLFVLPAGGVPVVAALAMVVGGLPDVVRGNVPAHRLLVAPANAWYSVGPAALLAAAGSPGPLEAAPALLIGMLAAQFGGDFLVSSFWNRLTRGAGLREQLDEVRWAYSVDAALAPLGLLASLTLDESPWYLLLTLPLLGLLGVFARERQARLEQLLELNHAYRGTAIVLGDVVGADDAYTGEHSRSVVELSLAVADELGLDARRRRNVEFGALLHDVGKVAIPNEIINKPGPLTDEEWALMRTHTAEGQRILDRVGGFMREVGVIVRASHERWDGGGYPDGLAGEAVPLEARIIAPCDAFDAMTTTRSYRATLSPAEALAELHRCSGTQFDPRVVAALLSVLDAAPVAAERALLRRER